MSPYQECYWWTQPKQSRVIMKGLAAWWSCAERRRDATAMKSLATRQAAGRRLRPHFDSYFHSTSSMWDIKKDIIQDYELCFFFFLIRQFVNLKTQNVLSNFFLTNSSEIKAVIVYKNCFFIVSDVQRFLLL